MVKLSGQILIIDDDKVFADNFADYFETIGSYRVYKAYSSDEAKKICQGINFDIIFLDVMLQGESGLALVEDFKNVAGFPSIVLMTGYPSIDTAIQGMRKGASDFLLKPFDIDMLKLTVERLLKKRKKPEAIPDKTLADSLYSKLNSKIKEQSLLLSITDSLSRVKNKTSLHMLIAELAKEVTESDISIFMLLNSEQKEFIPVGLVTDGGRLNLNDISLLSAKESVLKTVLQDNEPVLINDKNIVNNLIKMPFYDYNKERIFSSLMIVPLIIQDNNFGLVYLVASRHDYTEDQLSMAVYLLERAALTFENIVLHEGIIQNLKSSLEALVTTLEAKDKHTNQHSKRVTKFAVALGRRAGISSVELGTLHIAASLHDIGKVGIRDNVLMKSGRLLEDEFDEIKRHPIIGANIVGKIGILNKEALVIRYHHERWDGTGYPDCLKGEEIPLLSRIITIADSFDAMTSDRPYRKRMNIEFAIKEFKRCKGTQFCPQLTDLFLELIQNKKNL